MEGLEGNTLRYAKLLAEAADEVMPEPSEDLALADAIDVLHQQARLRPGAFVGYSGRSACADGTQGRSPGAVHRVLKSKLRQGGDPALIHNSSLEMQQSSRF